MQRPKFECNMVLMVFFVSFIATSMIISTPIAQASPTTYYVRTTGSDVTGDGSSGNPWKTINYAIGQVVSDDKIMVEAGTYDEIVVINKKISLISKTKHGAIIKPTSGVSWPNMGAVNLMADGVTFSGFEVDGSGTPGNHEVINAYGVSDVVITHNLVHGATSGTWDGMGIAVWDWTSASTVDNATIEYNEVYDTGRMGIFCMDFDTTNSEYDLTKDHTISGNIVYDTWKKGDDWGDAGGGIQINAGKDCIISDNTIYNIASSTYADHYNPCIYMFGSGSGNTITNNVMRDSASGITLWISGEGGTTIDWEGDTATSPEVHCNNIYGNTNYGAVSINVAGTTMVMDATDNWWGDASGPYHPTLNPSGQGDTVTDNVDFDPWQINYPACQPPPVGGEWIAVNKFELLAPWMGLVSLMIVAAVSLAYVKRRKKHQN